MLYVLTALLALNLCNAADSFSVSGNKVMKNGQWVVFNGISFSCTEYMMRTNLGPLWGYDHCFGGVTHEYPPVVIQLNAEPANIINMLVTNFEQNPTINKVKFASPYDQVIDADTPQKHPIVRIPTSGSTYLYDMDCVTNNHSDYVNSLDLIITNMTDNGIAVAFDLHWSCPDPSAMSPPCSILGPGPMALKEFGAGNMGAVDFWDAVSKKYASNPYVFYELYNEPSLKWSAANFDIYYNGSDEYAGMKQMYEAVRKNDPTGLIILAGMQQYAWDASTQIAFYLRYMNETGSPPTNLMFNYHPYQGQGQGLEKSLQGVVRFTLAGQTLAPVILTEFGQYCCSPDAEACSNGATGPCTAHPTGDTFSSNLVNLALQYDISWTAWAWLGVTGYTCDALRECNNLRNANGSYIMNGTWGGAHWAQIWDTMINVKSVNVLDTQKDANSVNVAPTVEEKYGYLPRPCIMGNYNLNGFCGQALDTDLTHLPWTDFAADSVYQSVLPGIPPDGNCKNQGCPTHACQASTGCS